MAGAFDVFTGDVKESKMHAAQPHESCPSPLEGPHLPKLFVSVVKSLPPRLLIEMCEIR